MGGLFLFPRLFKAYLRRFVPEAFQIVKTPYVFAKYMGNDIAVIQKYPQRLPLALGVPYILSGCLQFFRYIIRYGFSMGCGSGARDYKIIRDARHLPHIDKNYIKSLLVGGGFRDGQGLLLGFYSYPSFLKINIPSNIDIRDVYHNIDSKRLLCDIR